MVSRRKVTLCFGHAAATLAAECCLTLLLDVTNKAPTDAIRSLYRGQAIADTQYSWWAMSRQVFTDFGMSDP
jgi:hypothetical protein